MNVYSVFDKKANRFISVSISETDETFVRSGMFALLMDYPLADIEFYQVGQFDADLGIIKPCKPRLCDWECYRFPTTRLSKTEFLTTEQIDEKAKSKKHEFLKQLKDTIPDLERSLSIAKSELNKSKIDKDKKRIKELTGLITEIRSEINNIKEMK